MKYIRSITRKLLLAGVLLGLGGCGNFDEINRNPNEVTDEELGRDFYDVGANIRIVQSYVIPTDIYLYQFSELLCGGSYAGYAETIVPSFVFKFSVYNPESGWNSAQFVSVLKNFYPDYRDIMQKDNAVAQAIGRICRVGTMLRVTDTYGPIPYSGVVKEDAKEVSLTVAYDSQEEVYNNMFKDLDKAVEQLKANLNMPTDGLKKFDGVYGGDVHKWILLANSFKLRLALRISYIAPELAQRQAEAAYAGGVILDNVTNASLSVAVNQVAEIINTWEDHRVGADLICYMNGYADPRRDKYFTPVEVKEDEKTAYVFAGMRIGAYPLDKEKDKWLYSTQIIKASDKYLWMSAAEVTFLRAEGALKGWAMGGDARSLYEKAIELSFEERGVTGAAAYAANTTKKPEDYKDPKGIYNCKALSTITIAWEDSLSPEAKERNLERIITQKWIAIYPLATEAWAEFRRTGYPRLMPVPEQQNHSGGIIKADQMARRLSYPVEEQTENAANLQQAVVLLGGPDNIATRLWWDCRTLK